MGKKAIILHCLADREWQNRLEVHLRVLQNAGHDFSIESWNEKSVPAIKKIRALDQETGEDAALLS